MIYYFCASLVCLSICLMIYSYYLSYRDNKFFRGDRVIESPRISKLLDAISPDSDSAKSRILDDYCYVVDSNWSVRDLYFIKSICLVLGLVIGLSIAVTNTVTRYNDVFSVDVEVPIEIGSSDYKILSDKLTFNEKDLTSELSTVDNNISKIENSASQRRYTSTNHYNIYKYLTVMHKKLGRTFNILDWVLVIVLTVLGFKLPTMVLKFLFKTMENNLLFEFDDLETTLFMLSDEPVHDVLLEMENSSLFMRQLFYDFSLFYKQSAKDAYRLIESRPEFPEEFKRLIRYCNMIDTSGPNYMRTVILASKENTERSIFAALDKRNRKKMSKIKAVCTVCFLIGILRLILTLF